MDGTLHENQLASEPIWAGVFGAVGKISAFQPQRSQFDPRLGQDLN